MCVKRPGLLQPAVALGNAALLRGRRHWHGKSPMKPSLAPLAAGCMAKNTAQHFGNGENHLSMRDLMTYRSRDPFTGGSHASLMASGTKVAGLAGEGEQPFMAAVGTFEAREIGSKITAAEEGFDGGDGSRFERAEYRALRVFVIRGKGTPTAIHKLPER